MPKVILGTKAREEEKLNNRAKRIIRCLPSNAEVAKTLGNSPQAQCYRTKQIYPKMIPELIKVLDLAGYEIVEKD